MSCLLMASNRLFILALVMLVPLQFAQAQILAMPAWRKATPGKLVQTNSAYGPVSTQALAYTSNVKVGNMLVVCETATAGASISDSASHVWTLGPESIGGGGANGKCWFTVSTVNTKPTITLTGTGGFVVMAIMEISGVSAFDTYDSAAATGATPSVSVQSPSNSKDYFAVHWSWDWNAYATWTAGSGFALQTVDGNGTGYIAALQTKMVYNGTALRTASVTKNFTGNQWGSMLLTFKEKQEPITNVQTVTNSVTTGTSISATLPNVRAGSTLLACMFTEGGQDTISDSVNGTGWTGTGSVGNILCYRYRNSAAGSPVVTVTQSASGPMGLVLFELRGFINWCNEGSTANGNGSLTVSPVTISIPTPNSYVFAMAGTYWAAATYRTYSVDPTSAADWTMKAGLAPSGGKYAAAVFELNAKQGLSGTRTIKINIDSAQSQFDSFAVVCYQ